MGCLSSNEDKATADRNSCFGLVLKKKECNKLGRSRQLYISNFCSSQKRLFQGTTLPCHWPKSSQPSDLAIFFFHRLTEECLSDGCKRESASRLRGVNKVCRQPRLDEIRARKRSILHRRSPTGPYPDVLESLNCERAQCAIIFCNQGTLFTGRCDSALLLALPRSVPNCTWSRAWNLKRHFNEAQINRHRRKRHRPNRHRFISACFTPHPWRLADLDENVWAHRKRKEGLAEYTCDWIKAFAHHRTAIKV